MLSKFRFINYTCQRPLLAYNEEWLTSTWVYLITGILGALAGITLVGSALSYTSEEAAIAAAIFGGYVITVIWCGCSAAAFYEIPNIKYALIRSVFDLIAISLVYVICMALSIIAIIVICIFIALFFIAFAGKSSGRSSSSSSSSSAPDEVYDGNGNRHYVSSSLSNYRVITTDGDTMHRQADGTYRNVN